MEITLTVSNRGCIHVDETPRGGVRIDLAELNYEEGFFVLSLAEAKKLKRAVETIVDDIEERQLMEQD